MGEYSVGTPVALFVYNRPHTTRQVIDQVAKVKPSKLLIVADGPLEDSNQSRQCQRTREVISETVAWPCDLQWNVASTNMGLVDRVVSGLRWIFTQVDEAIILEDDCVPNVSFFRFCERMLDEYRHDKRIMDIGGTNILETWKSEEQSYHFSRFGSIWGWATWRRAWEWFDPEMTLWNNEETRSILNSYWPNPDHANYMEYIFERKHRGKIISWAYAWAFSRMVNGAYSVAPAKNLVSNVGFGANATNTKDILNSLANIPTYELDFPIQIQSVVVPDYEYDQLYYETRPISHRNKFGRLFRKIFEAIFRQKEESKIR